MMDNSYPMRHHVLPVFGRPARGGRVVSGMMMGESVCARVGRGLAAVVLAVVLVVCMSMSGCARVQQWRQDRATAAASAASAASASAADAAEDEDLKNFVTDDVNVCDIMSAGDMEAILRGQQLKRISFHRSTLDDGRVELECLIDLVAKTPYAYFPADQFDISYGSSPRERPLIDDVNAIGSVRNVREVSIDGMEGQGVAFFSLSLPSYYLKWRYPDGYELSVRMIGGNRLQWSDDPTDTILIPMLKAVAGTIHAAASGPPEQEAIYPPNGTATASPTG
jgi:hypothetical protein